MVMTLITPTELLYIEAGYNWGRLPFACVPSCYATSHSGLWPTQPPVLSETRNE